MVFFIITDRNGFSVPPQLWIYAIIAGVLYCISSFLTYIALSCGSFAISMLILSYGLIFNIVYGLFFLKEEADIFTYLGLMLIMISLFLTRGKKEQNKENKKISFKWLISILISFFGSGMFGVISRMQQIRFDNSCTNEFMIIVLCFSAIVLFATGMMTDGKNTGYVIKHGSIYTILAGISNGLTNYMVLVVNEMVPISLASPIRSGVKIIITFLISKLIFREQFLKRQIAGVLLGTLALVLLNL
ncbi:MAG: purine permease [Ruminococcaceae bacterium]|nr:purine permease [Oscillospiraceae bacterium]